jgi:predicted phosphodiesterase
MVAVHTDTKVLVVSDFHAPFHCEDSLAVVKSAIKYEKPDIVVILGDLIDATAISTFPKDVEKFDQLDEFESGNQILDDLSGKHKIYFVLGNHEQRFYRPGLIPQATRRLLDPLRWLNIKKRGIKWFPYSHFDKDILRFGKLAMVHGFGFSQYATMKAAQRFGHVVTGHIHRIQVLQAPHVKENCTGYCIGCMCKLDQSYVACRDPHGWKNAFGIGHLYRGGGYSFNIAELSGSKVHINNREYKI